MKVSTSQPPARLSREGKLRARDVALSDQGTGSALPPGVRGRTEARGDERFAGLPEERLEELRSLVSEELVAARDYIDNEIGPERARATQFYKGEPFGFEEEGRSQVVSRDVHDVVQGVMPTFMRIFTGGETVVEYVPRRAEDEEAARQATDYINSVVVFQDNDGFREIHSAIKDALIRKNGIWKWWWDDQVELLVSEHDGISDEDLQALSEDEDIERVEAELQSEEGIVPRVWGAKVHRRRTAGRARFKAIPLEEFLIDRRATGFEDASVVGHRASLRVKDVVGMGFDRDEVLEHAGSDNEFEHNVEFQARKPNAADFLSSPVTDDLRLVAFTEAYTFYRISNDEKDPAQLVKISGIGIEPFHLLSVEPVDEVPFASISPDPEAHEFFGQSLADKTDDVQLVKSVILRGTLDSLAQALNPRTEAVEGMVNFEDLLNNEVGGVVRVRAPGSLREMDTRFVGKDTLPMLEYYDQIREERVKQSRASQGLDADALQSTTKAAVTATMTAAQAQVELIARIFAETGFKRLFKGLLRLTIRHQDRPRTVRLRNQWVVVDPRDWDAEMDLRVNVAIGAGTADEKLSTLVIIKQTQEEILKLLGLSNPLVSLEGYRHTLATMLELSGWKNPDAFFLPIDPNAPAAPAGGEGGPEDPAQALAAAQAAETQSKLQIKQMDLEFQREKLQLEHQREMFKAQLDAQTRIAIAEAQTRVDIDNAAVAAEVERQRSSEEARVRQFEAVQQAEAAIQQEQIAAQAQQQQQQVSAGDAGGEDSVQ
jgi:hypothetical protein